MNIKTTDAIKMLLSAAIGLASGVVLQHIQYRNQLETEKEKYIYQSRLEMDKITYRIIFESVKIRDKHQAARLLQILQDQPSAIPTTMNLLVSC